VVKEEAFMRLYRNMIILVVVSLVLVGALVAVKRMPKGGTAGENTLNSISLSEFDGDQVTEFFIESTEGKYALKKKDTEWELTSGGNFPLNITNIESLITNSSDLNAYKLIEENAVSLDKYGLDNPYRLTIKMSDGTQKVLEVGSLTPTKEAYYMKTGDSNNVYVVYTFIADFIIVTEDELRNKYVFDVYSTDVIKFELDREGKKVFSAEKTEELGWQIKEPLKGNADLVRLTTIFDAFVRATASTYIEENAQDFSQYGLDNPRYVIEAATADKDVKLFIGKSIEGDSLYYGRLDGSNEVFTIEKGSLSFLDIQPIEVCESLIFTPFIYDVSEVVVSIDGKTTVSQIESDSSNTEADKFTVDGIDVISKGREAEEAFRNYYRSIVGVYITELELLDEKPTGTPEISIKYTLEIAPDEMVIEFIPKDDRKYYVFENGEYSGKVINGSVFDEGDGIRKNYERLMKILQEK
jgi:hypothetical protein